MILIYTKNNENIIESKIEAEETEETEEADLKESN